MIKTSTLTRILVSAILLIVLAGCTDPTSHPIIPPPPLREGDVLDTTASDIWPSTTGRPWIVPFDWTIGSNRTVTIHPGTEIMFAPFKLDGKENERPFVAVEGKLTAVGTPEQPIFFTTAFQQAELGQWRGIRLTNSQLASEFKYCVFLYGAYYDIDTVTTRGREAQSYKGMLALRNSSPVIEHCLIYKNQDNGIFIHGENSHPVIRYNIISMNDASGIRADRKVVLDPANITISYNCVAGDNSAPAFLMGYDSTTFGVRTTVNANLDSCDIYYNFEQVPVMLDPLNRHYDLTSCSPCVDAGPRDVLEGTPPTRIDIGCIPYQQVAGELRGVVSGTLDASIPYRMSCNLRVSEEDTLIIPAGTRIEVSDLYYIEAFGKIVIDGTSGSPVRISPCPTCPDLWGGIRFFAFDTLSRRGQFVREPSLIKFAELVDYKRVEVIHKGVRFENVTFDGGFDFGVSVNTGSTDWADSVSFQNCEFKNCGIFGVEVDGSSAAIRNSLISYSKGRGISLYQTGDKVDITNCIVHSCSTSALTCYTLSSPRVVNNVFFGNSYFGIELFDNCYPLIQNNIVANNRRYGIRDLQSNVPDLSYNDFFNNLLGNYSPDTLSRLNSIEANPQFVGPTDFHLASGSPCINSGNPAFGDAGQAPGDISDIGAYGGPGASVVGTAALRFSNNRIAFK